ncbi:MAG: glucose 1-dehydrogenase [Dehalococcoidia bacterium]|nr:glucose 1-dehydrogenase [Dehalococcoidia bacterium]
MKRMEGRVALVTGAGRGIGQGIARRLASEGARVCVADLDPKTASATANEIGNGLALEMDVTSGDSVRNAVAECERQLGPIEILVNNAGWEKPELFIESNEETWDRVIAVNYRGVLNCTRAVLPGMVERQRGRIVSISSDAGRVGSGGEAVYSGAKAAIQGFSKAIAREVARYSINVNVVCPGPARTEMFAAVSEASPRLGQALEKAIPFKRLAEPEDVANAVAFFVSDDAAYMTGQVVSVSGGLTMA